ncbi:MULTISPECIES: hypothetical protein [Streptomyces]|nr:MULTISPECIES: hypothetical protein [Streptomyces]GHF06143.1 hypothetical protein GCM10010359_03980 [Streptomyces morookaense]
MTNDLPAPDTPSAEAAPLPAWFPPACTDVELAHEVTAYAGRR